MAEGIVMVILRTARGSGNFFKEFDVRIGVRGGRRARGRGWLRGTYRGISGRRIRAPRENPSRFEQEGVGTRSESSVTEEERAGTRVESSAREGEGEEVTVVRREGGESLFSSSVVEGELGWGADPSSGSTPFSPSKNSL